ncbi:MAG: YdiU family protein [Bdellovibrionota bacterium]|nr:YdiU family protein [Bdellovibrionota bacterium]
MIQFENSYLELPTDFYEFAEPEKVSSPSLIAFNHSLAREIGLNVDSYSDTDLSEVFSGNKLLQSSKPMALAYAGYQFGHPVPQLGDGRAHLLGQVSGFDVQLKGSGRTSFSRNGDGKSALGPVIREYIISEAMSKLGVPTTRALCAVRTGEEVYRQDGPEPGGIFTRVAESHLRVGSFQYFAFREDLESLELLLNYTIERHYPELSSLSLQEKSIQLLKELTAKQSDLIAKWSSLGFIHGVMNTDNFSLAGITIDYGPCAFMEDFQFNKVFSSIDHRGRYSFFNQAPIAKWNILRLADCLLPFINSDQEKAIAKVEEEVISMFSVFEEKRFKAFARKLGVEDYKESDNQLVMQFLEYLEKHSLDFTTAFYYLDELFAGEHQRYPQDESLNQFLVNWKRRVGSTKGLRGINPFYIPRNHLVQKAIDKAYLGDYSFFNEFNKVLMEPYTDRGIDSVFSRPAEGNERVEKTFCGT